MRVLLRVGVAVVAVAVVAAGCGGGATAGDGGGGVAGGGGSSGGGDGSGGAGGSGGGGGTGGVGGGNGGSGGGTPACTLSAPQVLVAGTRAPYKVAVDATNVYYVQIGSAYAGVYSVAKTGGAPALVAGVNNIQSDGGDFDVAVDDTTIYLLDGGRIDASPTSARLVVVDKATGAIRYVNPGPPPADCLSPLLTRLAVAAGVVYVREYDANWVHDTACNGVASRNWISVVDPGATVTRRLFEVPTGANPILADATHIFWSDGGATYRALHDPAPTIETLAPVGFTDFVSDGNTLFGYKDGWVTAIPAPGRTVPLYNSAATVAGIAVDDAHVYFGVGSGIMRITKNGSDPQLIVANQAHQPVVDDSHVYFFAGNDLVSACK